MRLRVITLHSPMPADAVARALQRANDGGQFVGKVDETSFRLRQPTESSRGIKPTIRGTIRALERGSEVRLVFRVNPLPGLLVPLCFAGMGWPMAEAFWGGTPWEVVLISLLLVLCCSAALVGFLADARKTERTIGQLIQGRHVKAAAEPARQ